MQGTYASTIEGCEIVQNKLVKYAPFHSWFMILSRKLLKLDFLASVNLILMYRRVPRCAENKGKAVPLNSKQTVPSGRETRYPLYTLSNKNPSAWNFLSPEPEVTCGTVAIIIRVVLLPHICAFLAFLCLPFITINHTAYVLTEDNNTCA